MSDLKIELGLLATIWLVCSLVAWGSYAAKQDIGIIGIITWCVSIFGIIIFVISLLDGKF
jgi:hypothetical protein